MTFTSRKGVSLIKYTPEVKKEADIIVVRSFIADDVDIDNPLWRSQKMCDFLDIFYKQLSDLKGNDGSIDYPHEILDPKTESTIADTGGYVPNGFADFLKKGLSSYYEGTNK